MKDWLFITSAVTAGLLAALLIHNAYQEADRWARRKLRDRRRTESNDSNE